MAPVLRQGPFTSLHERTFQLKGPQVLVQAAELLRRRRPDIDLKLTILGALRGASDLNLGSLVNAAGMDDVVTHLPPVGAPELAGWYRSPDVVVMPSYSESFGLVAISRQAMGRAAAIQAESSDWRRTAAITLESSARPPNNTPPVRNSWPSNAAPTNASAAFRDPSSQQTL